jgi:hypothetical protein
MTSNEKPNAAKNGNIIIEEAHLVDFDPSVLILREATTSEKIACWRANSASWAGILTPEDYIGRETVNGSGELTRDGRIKYWVFTKPASRVLADTTSPHEAGSTENGVKSDIIYSALETLKKDIAVKTREDGFSIESIWAIASVFTPLHFRRKKIASWMMRRLAEWLDKTEQCKLSILFSDVGVSSARRSQVYPTLQNHYSSAFRAIQDAKLHAEMS